MPEPSRLKDPHGQAALVTERSEDGAHLRLKTEDGRETWIDSRLIEGDRLTVPLLRETLPQDTLEVVQERLAVGRRVEETGIVTIHKTVSERPETVRTDAVHETVSVETVPVGRFVDGPPEVRQEGDTTVVPVLEEVIVVEKRLRLREEVRITRTRTTVPFEETVMLRQEEIVVERDEP